MKRLYSQRRICSGSSSARSSMLQFYTAFIGFRYDSESSLLSLCGNDFTNAYLQGLYVRVENVQGRPGLQSTSTACYQLTRMWTLRADLHSISPWHRTMCICPVACQWTRANQSWKHLFGQWQTPSGNAVVFCVIDKCSDLLTCISTTTSRLAVQYRSMHVRLQVSVCSGYDLCPWLVINIQTHRQTCSF